MENIDKNYIIAIDGPSGSGKSSLSQYISKKLGILYIDTGAMYRATALYFLENSIEINEENIVSNIDNINIKLEYVDSIINVYLNGINVTEKIRENSVSMATSNISKFKVIREKLVFLQRELSKGTSVILDGRDIGTVVFPNANLKIFLNASIEIRASRRKKDLELKNQYLSIEDIIKDLEKRDFQDMTRKESPLKKAEDAIEIYTTYSTIENTSNKIITLLKERMGNIKL